MIEYIKKDVCDIETGVIAHGVNCRGVMGSGVAGALRRKYPHIFTSYKNICDLYTVDPKQLLGSVDAVDIGSESEPLLIVVNCFTQDAYGRDGKRYASASAVQTAVDTSVQLAIGLGIPFYMPKIGCGLGGLSWENEVEPFIIEIADKYNTTIFICDI